jgi:hypothetical protein
MGKIRQEENALWSFATHNISVMLALVGQMPVQVTADRLRPTCEGGCAHAVSSWTFPPALETARGARLAAHSM